MQVRTEKLFVCTTECIFFAHHSFHHLRPKSLGIQPFAARAKRVAEAMLKMVKLDIDGLKKGYEGR